MELYVNDRHHFFQSGAAETRKEWGERGGGSVHGTDSLYIETRAEEEGRRGTITYGVFFCVF